MINIKILGETETRGQTFILTGFDAITKHNTFFLVYATKNAVIYNHLHAISGIK